MSDNNISGYDNYGEVINLDFTPILGKIYDIVSGMVFPLYENQQKITDNMMDIIMKNNDQINNKIDNDKQLIIPARIIEK